MELKQRFVKPVDIAARLEWVETPEALSTALRQLAEELDKMVAAGREVKADEDEGVGDGTIRLRKKESRRSWRGGEVRHCDGDLVGPDGGQFRFVLVTKNQDVAAEFDFQATGGEKR
jgi:hypothetical protein